MPWKKTCLKQPPLKLSSNLKISQLTTNLNVKFIAFKLAPSFVTNVMIFYLWPKESKKLFKFKIRIYPVVLIASNNPIVTYFGCCQFASRKLTTNDGL
jgi:hypothetical protein